MDSDVLLGVRIMISGLMGAIVAFIEYTLYTNKILLDEFITGTITISDVMAVTVIVFFLVGIVVAVMKH